MPAARTSPFKAPPVLWGRRGRAANRGFAANRAPSARAASKEIRAVPVRSGRAAQLVQWGLAARRACAATPAPRATPERSGPQGEKGDTGETPVITVAEDTPLSYKLHFKTSEQELTTPNLFAPLTEYHVDLSAANSTLDIPLKDLVLTYQRSSTSALRISIAPKDTAAPVLVDIRRTTIYDGSTIETQTMNSTTLSSSIAIDGTVYTNSQETHNMRIRQQDPATQLWSLCEVSSFLSAGGARCSIRIQWYEYDVTYQAPTA